MEDSQRDPPQSGNRQDGLNLIFSLISQCEITPAQIPFFQLQGLIFPEVNFPGSHPPFYFMI